LNRLHGGQGKEGEREKGREERGREGTMDRGKEKRILEKRIIEKGIIVQAHGKAFGPVLQEILDLRQKLVTLTLLRTSG